MKLIIDIHVSNLARAILFYTKKLGLELRLREAEWAALSVGDAEIHLYTGAGATGHVEFYVDDIYKKVEELTQVGIVFQSGITKPHAVSVDELNITTFPWGKTAFFLDSEGNELAIVKDN